MEITKALQDLAKFSAGPLPVISVYLNTQWHDQHQRERVTTFLRQHVRQARLLAVDAEAPRQSLEADLGRIAQWGEQLVHGTGELAMPGMALFTCHGADLWVELPAPMPFEDEFTVADRPALRQLARLDEDYTNALVVLVDSRAARICEVVLGGFLSETDFASEVPGRDNQGGRGGGWGQVRYQQRQGGWGGAGRKCAISGVCKSIWTAITRKSPNISWPISRPDRRHRSFSADRKISWQTFVTFYRRRSSSR